ncbi:hypothetical protein DEO72_LG8g2159 [Vigna unguiculata]|uniref:Uncharacterized protein n=1 Tax=Vigna unguiculata TaxID=3917 RepID=A0A4D6MRM7_VIGUN|nr:hypothetical protein DEO72_LG8g2159 [Vigna unguiculata]
MSLTTSSNGSGRSREGIGRQSDEESGNHVVRVGRISMETVTKVREDPPEEIAESSWPAKAFSYFYDTRPQQPTTWLPLVSRTNISRLDAFMQSFKHFKDGFFKAVRYKDMKLKEFSVADKEVVETLMKFTNRLPTKGLVWVYNSVHPIIDIEGHMAQLGKKNLTLFQTLRKEKAARARAV